MTGPSLVTGATGFAGRHLVDHLLTSEPAVAAWANPRGAPAGTASRRSHGTRWIARPRAVGDTVAALSVDGYHCAGALSRDLWAIPHALKVKASDTPPLEAVVSPHDGSRRRCGREWFIVLAGRMERTRYRPRPTREQDRPGELARRSPVHVFLARPSISLDQAVVAFGHQLRSADAKSRPDSRRGVSLAISSSRMLRCARYRRAYRMWPATHRGAALNIAADGVPNRRPAGDAARAAKTISASREIQLGCGNGQPVMLAIPRIGTT